MLYVAEGDNRFLHQPELPVSDHLTYTQAAQKIQLINSALDILDILREDSVGGQSNLSEKVCANLEHLLLRIRECLVQTFVRKAWTEVSESPEWQHYWRRQLKFGGDKWCAEFSNNHRPVSTTWPWSIKPSLAVLWGVCWMFYPQGNEAGYQRPRSEAQAYGISPVYHYAQPVVGVRGVQHPILPSQGMWKPTREVQRPPASSATHAKLMQVAKKRPETDAKRHQPSAVVGHSKLRSRGWRSRAAKFSRPLKYFRPCLGS